MIAAGLAILTGVVVLILFAGYTFGRAEAEAECAERIASLEDTIDALTAPLVRVLD